MSRGSKERLTEDMTGQLPHNELKTLDGKVLVEWIGYGSYAFKPETYPVGVIEFYRDGTLRARGEWGHMEPVDE